MTLSDFTTQFDSINASFGVIGKEIADLQAQVTGSLSPADAASVLASLTDIATKATALGTLVPPVPVA